MKIHFTSIGKTTIDADGEYQEPAIRKALQIHAAMGAQGAGDLVPAVIAGHAGGEWSDIDHDEYAIVTEDDGTVLWAGWLDGRDEPAPDGDGQQRYIDQLHDLIRDMLTAYPGLAMELPRFQDRAGQLYVHDTDGQPFGEPQTEAGQQS